MTAEEMRERAARLCEELAKECDEGAEKMPSNETMMRTIGFTMSSTAQDLAAAIRAIPIPDTAWRPSVEPWEVAAHKGLWMCRWAPDSMEVLGLLADEERPVGEQLLADLGSDMLPATSIGGEWRPYDADGNPAPWPTRKETT